MRRTRWHLLLLFFLFFLLAGSEATTSGTLAAQYLSSLLSWATSSSSSPGAPQPDAGDLLQFETGYVVETLVEGSKLGVQPYTVRVSPEGGELLAVDHAGSNIVRIAPPLSQYSRARLVAGSFQGYSGHVDGKPSDARFYHPKSVAVDGRGNVYVADTGNMAVRKIGEAGVTTIAGGKSNVAGYRDGPSEDAKFSSDFDVVYVGSTCSLLVVDRGNAAIRQISLRQEDCSNQYSSISTPDVIMVAGAVLVGYISCLLQRGSGSSLSDKTKPDSVSEYEDYSTAKKPSLHVEALKEDVGARWPSFSRLVIDLARSAVEASGSAMLSFVPKNLIFWKSKKGLTPLKHYPVMPEERMQPLLQKQKNPLAPSESLMTPDAGNTFLAQKSQKVSKLPMFKDPLLSSKHRSSKRQEFGDLYVASDAQQVGSKMPKERIRHRHRDKTGEVSVGNAGNEHKAAEVKPVSFADSKFENFSMRSKFGADNAFNF